MGSLLHLARRFWQVVRARPLRPAEQSRAAALLRPAERPLFWRQTPADQRHGWECAARVMTCTPARRDLARAALLHDVGKGIVGLPVPGRVLAGVLALLHWPAPRPLRAYLAHGPCGADALAKAGAEPVVVAYARHHHGSRPPAVPVGDWDLLARADHP